MTIQEVVKLNDDVLNAWKKHDTQRFLSLCTDRVIWRDTGSPHDYTGRDGAKKYFETWLTAFPDFTLDVKKTIVGENSIAGELEFSGTNNGPLQMEDAPEIPATHKKVTANRCSYLAWFKDGKVTEVHTYPDLAGMMAELGLIHEMHSTH